MGCGEVDDAILTGHYSSEIIVHADIAVFPKFRIKLALYQIASRDLMLFYEQLRQSCADKTATAED